MGKYLRRRRELRPLKKTFLIVCEGQSEEIYFKNMKRCERLTNINIEIVKPHASTPKSICLYARKEKKKKEYDVVYCVFDCEVWNQGVLGEIGSRPDINIITSTPCFEIWILLHYKYTSREFCNCKELITSELKKHIPDYEKSKAYHSQKNLYLKLKNELSNAIRHAKRLNEENQKNKKTNGTSTEIYKIIETVTPLRF